MLLYMYQIAHRQTHSSFVKDMRERWIEKVLFSELKMALLFELIQLGNFSIFNFLRNSKIYGQLDKRNQPTICVLLKNFYIKIFLFLILRFEILSDKNDGISNKCRNLWKAAVAKHNLTNNLRLDLIVKSWSRAKDNYFFCHEFWKSSRTTKRIRL